MREYQLPLARWSVGIIATAMVIQSSAAASETSSISAELYGVTKKITSIEAFRPTPAFDRHDPSNIIRYEDHYWVFYTRNVGDHKDVSVHCASSADGYRWTDLGLEVYTEAGTRGLRRFDCTAEKPANRLPPEGL